MWPLRIRLALLLAVLLAPLCLRGFLQLTERATPGGHYWLKDRVRNKLLMTTFPRPNHQGRVFFLGASEAEVGFDPIGFDGEILTRGEASFSLNLSLRDSGHFFPLYLRRIRLALQESVRPPKIVFVHVSVSRLTKRSQDFYRRTLKVPDMWAVFFERSLWNELDLPLGQKVELLTNKYVWGERSLLQAPTFFANWLGLAVSFLRPPGVLAMPVYELEQISQRGPEIAGFQHLRRPFYGKLHEGSAPVREARRALELPGKSRDYLEAQDVLNDFFGLRFDPDYLREVASAIGSLKTVAEHVVIVDLPENPANGRSEESLRRRGWAFEQLAKDAEVELWRPEGFAQSYFMDPVHLGPEGVQKLTGWLAGRVPAGWLEKRQAQAAPGS